MTRDETIKYLQVAAKALHSDRIHFAQPSDRPRHEDDYRQALELLVELKYGKKP